MDINYETNKKNVKSETPFPPNAELKVFFGHSTSTLHLGGMGV